MSDVSEANLLVAKIMQGGIDPVLHELDEHSPDEIADALERLPFPLRATLWSQLSAELHASILPLLPSCISDSLVRQIDADELTSIAPMMDSRDAAALVNQLDEKHAATFIDCLSDTDTEAVNARLASAPESVLRWMREDAVKVQNTWTLRQVSEYIRNNFTELPRYTSSLLVVDDNDRYLGKLALAELFIGAPETIAQEVMDADAIAISDTASESEVAAIFDDRRLVQAPVVNKDGRLLGRVTVDEAIELIKKRSDDQFMKTAGLEHDTDLFATPYTSFKSRGIWLAINLVTVFLAAGVISFFQDTVQQVVALAVLMPIVSSMGGIAGSQTLTLTIRGLSMQQLSRSNLGWLFKKEAWVGVLHGLTWAIVVGLVTLFWFGSPLLGLSIAVALFLNLLAAAFVGISIPVILEKLGIDPALSGSVVLTTVTDILGFGLFLALATWWLM
jgi:magnesium transporter